MSTKKEIWRLLEPMDAGEDGDQWSSDGLIWRDIDKNTPLLTIKFRRRLVSLHEPQGWISVKERMPTKEDADDNGWVLWMFPRSKTVGWYPWNSRNSMANASNWMSVPAIPQDKKNPDEEAWDKTYKELDPEQTWQSAICAAKAAFLAGRKSVTTEKEDSHG